MLKAKQDLEEKRKELNSFKERSGIHVMEVILNESL